MEYDWGTGWFVVSGEGAQTRLTIPPAMSASARWQTYHSVARYSGPCPRFLANRWADVRSGLYCPG